MDRDERLALLKEMDAAEDEYLKLRDAKSNGCLGFDPPIYKVLEYDKKIMAAYTKYADLRDKFNKEVRDNG